MEYPKLKEILMEQSFTDSQFKEVKAICDIRLGNFSAKEAEQKGFQKSESDTYPMLFHSQLANILEQECDIRILPYHKLKAVQPKVHRMLVNAAMELYAISERWVQDKSKTRKFAVGVFFLYSELVVGYLRDCRVPVSLRTTLQHVDKFEGMVDKAFPGYLSSGAISAVILRPPMPA